KKEFSVRLIGRLVFCWFLKKKCSDKGTSLLPEKLLSSKAVIRKSEFYHNILEPLFFEILNTPIKERKKEYQLPPWAQIPFLNGGLFANEYNDYYEIDQLGISKYINTLKVPDSWLKELFEIFEIYNFTIDENTSVDVELSIEPEMLGRIFENLLAEINPETGNTARKATGSYYTPRPIVEYMVDESLKQYLLTKTNLDENKISSLLAYEEEETNLSESEKDAVIDALDVIKIIDPACGSGAFPMGILQKMLLILQKIDPESKKWLNKKISQIENIIVREEFQKKIEAENWNYVHKLGIIQNSIYGVDIQPIAVDISKLRFFLSLIVDEKVDDSKENRGIDSLPNLEFKFVCANSLIGLPNTLVGSYKKELQPQPKLFEAIDNITELKKLREEYLRCVGNEKKLIEKKFQEIQSEMFLNSLNWGGGDSQTVKLSQWNPFFDESCAWFDPEWMFGVRDGFDIVIANPPYVRQEEIIFKPELMKEYEIFNSISDLYTYFYERGFKLLKKFGVLTFITSNKFLRARYGNVLRKYLQMNTTIKSIINFGNRHMFEATTNTLIFIATKEKNDKNVLIYSDGIQVSDKNNFSQSALQDREWTIEKPEIIRLKSKVEEMGTLLKDWDIKMNRGILTGYNEAFIIDEATKNELIKSEPKAKEIIRPIIRGRDIKRYCYINSELFLIVTHNGYRTAEGEAVPAINIEEYSSVKRHLDKYIRKLKERQDKGITVYNLRDCAFMDDFLKEKIIWLELTNKNKFAYSDKEDYLLAGAFFMVGESLKYLLAFLNSKLCLFYFSLICNSSGMDTIQWKKFALEKVPVIELNSKDQKPFIDLIDQILAVTKSDDYLTNPEKQTKVKELEKQIDQLIYELYSLTDEEIKIIENFHKKV
ncbi:MAG: Eco57I restriction-modification methylase domain-containing protein, partial [Actinobacteria bacterium]|nr:Eco57I restriction-modification methylase domain-containing protein [Actinomycetota bacterium]